MATSVLRPLGVLAVATLVLSGCSSSGSTGTGNFPTNQVLPTGAPTLSVGPDTTGSQLMGASFTAIAAAKSFRVVGTTTAKRITTVIDMRYGQNGSQGTITLNKTTLQLIRIGADTFVKAPDDFWRTQLPAAQLAADLSHIHDHWVIVPAAGVIFGQLSAYTDKQQIVANLIHKDPSRFRRGLTKAISGVSTVMLTDSSNGAVTYIAAIGKPYPIEVISGKGTSAKAMFSDWDLPFSVQAPPASQIYSLPST